MRIAAAFERSRQGLIRLTAAFTGGLERSELAARLVARVGQASLDRTARLAFASQALLAMFLGIAAVAGISGALRDVADLNGVVRQQRQLLDARITALAAADHVRAYALNPDPASEQHARKAITAAADAVEEAAGSALTDEQEETLELAAERAGLAAGGFDRLVTLQKAADRLVQDRIYVEGAAIQASLNTLAGSAAHLGAPETAAKAREASATYSLVRIAMERFVAESNAQNSSEAKKRSLDLENVLNDLYASTSNAALLAETDRVIRRLISYDKAFDALVKVTNARDRHLARLLDSQRVLVAEAVGKVGTAVDDIQSSAANSARIKLGGLLSLSFIVVGAGMLFVLLASLVFRRAVTQPIVGITQDMQRLAEGALDQQAHFVGRKDEVGEMARALEVFRLNAIEVKRLQGEEAERRAAKERADQAARDAELRAAAERQRAMDEAEQAKRRMLAELAARFENQVAAAMTTLAQAAREIDEGARRVEQTVASSRALAASLTAAADEASASTATIASATEEMNLSLAEVSNQVTESSQFARRAVDRVGQTDQIVTSLARDAAEIGEVVSLVHDIAQQVNLLALNATIEASRAGEAGRGFAVVAAEVKSLAQQTAAATTRISERVGSIQNISQSAMQAINEIGTVIGEMGLLSSSVATAVEQQVSTTAEIARNTTLAATGTSQVTTHLRRVEDGVSVSGDAAEVARIAAEAVSRQARALQQEIEEFLASVRAA